MEFIELVKDILSFLPPEYTNLVQSINAVFPWIVLCISILVCLFGYKIHHLWSGFIFFLIGFLLGALIGTTFPALDVRFVLLLALGLGILGIVFTHKLIKIQIFLVNSTLVFTVLPNLLSYIIPDSYTLLIGFIGAIIAGLIAVRYKFIVTIITTSYVGAVTAAPILMNLFKQTNSSNQAILALIFISIGIIFQFYIHHKGTAAELSE